jgi:hypothetical protein
MITQKVLNDILHEINESYSVLFERIKSLEDKHKQFDVLLEELKGHVEKQGLAVKPSRSKRVQQTKADTQPSD